MIIHFEVITLGITLCFFWSNIKEDIEMEKVYILLSTIQKMFECFFQNDSWESPVSQLPSLGFWQTYVMLWEDEGALSSALCCHSQRQLVDTPKNPRSKSIRWSITCKDTQLGQALLCFLVVGKLENPNIHKKKSFWRKIVVWFHRKFLCFCLIKTGLECTT